MSTHRHRRATVLLLLPLTLAAPAVADSAAPPRVLRILPVGQRLWLGTTQGVWELDGGGLVARVWTETEGLPSAVIYDIAMDGAGTLWVATSRGVARKAAQRFEPVLDGLPAAVATVLLPLRSGELYAGTLRGIARFGGTRWEPVYETHEFGRDRVLAAAQAPDGTVWFAKERALTTIAPDGEMRVLHRDPLNPDAAVALPSTRAQALTFDVVGRLWLATAEGLSVLDGARLLAHERWRPGLWGVDGLPAHRVWSIWIDPTDTVWLTFGDTPNTGFVARRSRAGGSWEAVRLDTRQQSVAVYGVVSDAAGRIWAGTSSGLFRLEANRFVAWPLGLAARDTAS
jgi:ligand-binding sensor domain-containing protein